MQVWDECICQSDSDGDGRTNGEELGDPDCKWKPGSPNPSSIDLSHPGKNQNSNGQCLLDIKLTY